MISFDWAMKNQLRNKANFDILEGFLSALLKRDLIIKHLGESEGNRENKDDKYNRVDIFVEDSDNELIIVELQYDSEYDYFQRMLYGASKSIVEHISKGDPYENVRKIYSVNIVHFDLGTGDDYVYYGSTTFKGIHTNSELILSENQKKIFVKKTVPEIFPEYYLIKVRKFKEETSNPNEPPPPPLEPLDQWIYYFKTSKIKDDFTAKGMDKVREALAYENLTEAEKYEYHRDIEAARVRDSELHTKYMEGKVEGEAIGLEKGEAIGLEKAEEKVKAAEEKVKAAEEKAKNAKAEVAQQLLKLGIPIDQISSSTGLSEKEINNLKNKPIS